MRILRFILAAAAIAVNLNAAAQLSLKEEVLKNPDNEPAPVHPVPHPRQMKWHHVEYYAFFHYGMNTYTGKEWGKAQNYDLCLNTGLIGIEQAADIVADIVNNANK